MRQEGRLPAGTGTGYGLGWRIGGLDAPLDGAVWHTGATFGYSSMLFLLPERDIALVLQQNLHGLLHDGAMLQVGFGAARLLADGRAPAGTSSASAYHVTIWGTTALALALILAAGRSVRLLRRPVTPLSPLRRTTVTTAWILAGAVPTIAAAWLVAELGLYPLKSWLPDVFIVLCAAVIAGAATVALRLTLALRPLLSGRDRRAEPTTSRDRRSRPS